MIFARVLFMIGSVLALFGVWKLLSPLIYASIVPDFTQGVMFMIVGGVMALIGRQLEQRNNDGAGD